MPEADGRTAVADPPSATGLRRPVVAGIVGKAAEGVTLVLLATVVPRLLGPAGYGRLSLPGCAGWRLPVASLAGAVAVAGWEVFL